jgi:hypothetical protein
MAIETLDDIIGNMADAIGIFGAHGEEKIIADRCPCRVCFEIGLKARIIAAVDVERKLGRIPEWVKDVV